MILEEIQKGATGLMRPSLAVTPGYLLGASIGGVVTETVGCLMEQATKGPFFDYYNIYGMAISRVDFWGLGALFMASKTVKLTGKFFQCAALSGGIGCVTAALTANPFEGAVVFANCLIFTFIPLLPYEFCPSTHGSYERCRKVHDVANIIILVANVVMSAFVAAGIGWTIGSLPGALAGIGIAFMGMGVIACVNYGLEWVMQGRRKVSL